MSTALLRPDPLHAGNPANHGYERCARCGTHRPVRDLADRDWTWLHEAHGPIRMDGPVCVNEDWCTEQAKATGRLQEAKP